MSKRFTLIKQVFLVLVTILTTGQFSLSNPAVETPVAAQNSTNQDSARSNLRIRDYTFGYWQNGMRKYKGDESADVLCIESGHYGMALDMAQLDKPKFSFFDTASAYSNALKLRDSRMNQLAEAQLEIEFEQGGKIYRAKRCGAAAERLAEGRMHSARLWESARLVQHYDFQGLEFTDDNGEELITNAKLDLVAWPDSLTFNVEMEPVITLGDNLQQGIVGKGQGVYNGSQLIAHQPALEHEQFTVEAWVKVPEAYIHKNRSWIVSKNGSENKEGYFGIAIRGDSLIAALNIGGVDRRNYYEVKTERHSLIGGKWHHVVMTYDGKTLEVYLDGRKRDSVELNKKRVLGSGDMRIGKKANNSGQSARVVVDQLRVWNKVLNRHEIAKNARTPAKIANRENLAYVNDFETGADLKLPVWNNARLKISLSGAGKKWVSEKVVSQAWGVDQKQLFTLNCRLNPRDRGKEKIQAFMKHNNQLQVNYRDDFDCYVASIKRPKRKGKSGYNDIRDYDEIDITVDSQTGTSVPFLMEIIEPANITGICPVLCDEQGRPTGIPVQLSKNWHYSKMGAYLRAYALLPATKGQSKYKLKLVYGFYGTLPSASHAQLSLVGYNGNGRWDQLAIGCWGETYCMDVDMSCTDVAVTDVRLLMVRKGAEGVKWGWTDAGWGGDWLGLKDGNQQKLLFNGLKTAYRSHGPCLTDVEYNGFYGAARELSFDSTVRTLRTDDYARTFTTLNYTFDKKVSAEGWIFKVGRTGHYITPRIAYGNAAGLVKEHVVSDGLKKGEMHIPETTIMGAAPWWVSFPGGYHDRDGFASGYRALVIRSFRAVISGKEYLNPTIELPAYHISSSGKAGLDLHLKAPVGITEFNPGDQIHLDVEWITLPRQAADYYGPNAAFRQHLQASPSSWKTAHREAAGNDLKVSAEGGSVKSNYPVIIQAQKPNVTVNIKGGVGYVPIRFEGLDSAHGYELYQLVNGQEQKLDQAVHGNDFWQTDYDAQSKTYKITYNLPLDGLAQSSWILKKAPLKMPVAEISPVPVAVPGAEPKPKQNTPAE